jgi:hypothetical protein
MTLTAAINKFFGKKPQQTLTQFGNEIKKLTLQDKKELAEMLSKELKEEVTTT